MVEEVNVSCPGCDSVFSVPIEFCGETAECAECGVLFEIPAPPERNDNAHSRASSDDADTAFEPSTDTGPIKGVESKNVPETTNTVKLSRTGIGMIPEIKDSFQFSTEARPPAFSKPKPKSPPPKTSTPKSLKEEVMLPKWVTVNLRKDEEIIAVKETITPAYTAPGMVAAATFLSGILATITGHLSNMYVAFACVLAIAAAAFIVTFFMSAQKRRQALVLTDERAIYIGEKRIEAQM